MMWRAAFVTMFAPQRTIGLVVFHLDQHCAKRWMAVHGTHGPDDFCVTGGHGRLRLRQRAKRDPIRNGLGRIQSVRCGDGILASLLGLESSRVAEVAGSLAYTVVGVMRNFPNVR
jgi:hypothetical protein